MNAKTDKLAATRAAQKQAAAARAAQLAMARETMITLLKNGLSMPELNKLVADAAAGRTELTPAEFRARYPGAWIVTDKQGNKTYRWAARMRRHKYGPRVDVTIGTSQAEAIETYNRLREEVREYNTGKVETVPTLDAIKGRTPAAVAMVTTMRTIAQQLDRDMAERAADPTKAKCHNARSLLRKMLGCEAANTLTRERVKEYCAVLVWRGNKDKSIKEAIFHLRAVIARMIPDNDKTTRNLVSDMVSERQARLQPVEALWSDERATLALALLAQAKRKKGKITTADENEAITKLLATGNDYTPHTMRRKGLISPTAWASIEQKLIVHIVKPISRHTPVYRRLSTGSYLRAKHARRRVDIRKAREVVLFLRVIKGQFQRFEAMRALRWTPTAADKGNFVDFDAGELVLHDTKNTHAGRCIVERQALNPEIADELRLHRRRYPKGDEVFGVLPRDMSHALADYRDRAGITELDNIKWYSAKHTGITTARGSGAAALDLAAAAKVTAQTAETYYRQEERDAAARAHVNYHPVSEIKAARKGRLLSIEEARKNANGHAADSVLTARGSDYMPQVKKSQ
ncbi:MAG TPA: hypothetical protein PKM88_05345 [bacterium]|nr:hypothetical protein [bacterium]